jgi:aminopeptidase N
MRRTLYLAALLVGITGIAHAQLGGSGNPFLPPSASLHYAYDRDYDLQDLSVDIDVDYEHLTIAGSCVNTLAPLRDGVTVIRLMAGADLNISKATVDGKEAKFTHEGKWLHITAPVVLKKGQTVKVFVAYNAINTKAQPFGGVGGFHWIKPTSSNPDRVGFWTQGESESNSNWVPTWDYPNDFTTSRTRVTVPAAWNVIGNGNLTSDKKSADGKRRTFVWDMPIPHATYLLTICGGPFDIKEDKWEGVKLMYVVPKGEGYLIDGSFGDTKDMLSYYSKLTGVKYPWPKYAQDAMYDFGGGMENVSATTLGEGSLSEPREGYWRMASLNSHELGHQWFGDYVTCKDWGQIWLNESFATFMQMMYFEHSLGKNGYENEVENNTNAYLGEARNYKRPIMTRMYPNADRMFDSHTYPKGGVVLHTLRKWLGDDAFWAGIKLYLNTNAHTPVESWQLCKALTDSSGINCEPFFKQWIYSPGHPVLDSSWKWNADTKTLTLTVNQLQDTSDGTPVYDIPAKVGFIVNGKILRMPFAIKEKKNEITYAMDSKPDAVLFDPDHDFLREIPKLNWSAAELPLIFKYAPNSIDRATAMKLLLAGSPSQETVNLIVGGIRADTGISPVFHNLRALTNLDKSILIPLRPFFESLLTHANFDRRAEAVNALGSLPADPGTTAKLRALITPTDPIPVVRNAIRALAGWDKKGNKDVFEKALKIPSHRDVIASAARSALED